MSDHWSNLESQLDSFDEAWALGQPPPIGKYLDGVPLDEQRALLVELIKIDLERRWSDRFRPLPESSYSQRPLLDEYVQSFPQLGPIEELPPDLIVEEYRVRRLSGETPTADEYVRRFRIDFDEWTARINQVERELPEDQAHERTTRAIGSRNVAMRSRCPHCHHPLSIIDDDKVDEIVCDSCGNRFVIVDEDASIEIRNEFREHLHHFELIVEVGKGHFGVVWKAWDTELERHVAIKVPRRGGIDAAHSGDFFREARAAAQLKHPNIVAVHEVGRTDRTTYIVSDFVNGVTLRDWLKNERLTPQEAAELCLKMADALQHAHQHGVVHRDLKPGNVMLDRRGEPHIMDFGLAKRDAGEITVTADGHILGTPAYMSPEQAKGDSHLADHRSDVYSLGVILYELLTGELPFRGELLMLVTQITAEEPTSPRRLNSRIPRDMETICLKCLEKDPARRYQSADELAAELRRFLAGKPIHARRVGPIHKLWRWCNRNRTIAALIAIVALTLATSTAVSSTMYLGEAAANARIRELLSCMYVREADLLNSDDLMAALPWLAAALELDIENPVREPVSRMRMAAALKACPKLEQMWFHDGPVEFATASADGRFVLSVSDDKTARVWDAATGAPVTGPLAHSGTVFHGTFNHDARYIATACSDGLAYVWEVATGKLMQKLTHGRLPNNPDRPAYVKRVRFCPPNSDAPDDVIVATACFDNNAHLWNATTGESLGTLPHAGAVHDVIFDPTGQMIVTASYDGTARIWRWGDPPLEGNEKPLVLQHDSMVTAMMLSPDGSHLLTGTHDGSVVIWSIATGDCVGRQQRVHADAVTCVASSNDNQVVVTTSYDRTAKLWRFSDGQLSPRKTLTHAYPVTTVTFTPDSRQFATAGQGTHIQLWDTHTGDGLPGPVLQSGPIFHTSFLHSPGRGLGMLAACHDGSVRLWRLPPNLKSLFPLGSAPVISFSRSQSSNSFLITRKDPDLPLVVANGDDPGTWKHLSLSADDVFNNQGPMVSCGAISADGTRIAVGRHDGIVAVTNLDSNQAPLFSTLVRGAVDDVHLSANGDLLLTRVSHRRHESTLQCWDTAGSEEPLWSLTGNLSHVAFSPNNEMVAVADGSQLLVLDARTGANKTPSPVKHDERIRYCAFAPSGNLIVTCSDDKTAQVWHVSSGERAGPPLQHLTSVVRAQFSPNHGRLATVTTDDAAKVWDFPTATPLTGRLPHDHNSPAVMFNDDGSLLLTTRPLPATVFVWSIGTGELVAKWSTPQFSLIGAAFTRGHNRVAALFRRKESTRDRHIFDVLHLDSDPRGVPAIHRHASLLTSRKVDDTADATPLALEELKHLWADSPKESP